MKPYLLLLFIACQSCAAVAQDNWNKTPYQTKSLANDAIKDVYVKTSGGSISVSGAAGEAPRVEVYVHGNNNQQFSKEEIDKRIAEDYDLVISVSNHEVHAMTKRKHENGFNLNWKR